MTLTCDLVRAKLSEDLELQEDAALCEAVRMHMLECSTCQEFYRSLGEVIQCFKDYDVEAPADLHSSVIERLRKEGLAHEE